MCCCDDVDNDMGASNAQNGSNQSNATESSISMNWLFREWRARASVEANDFESSLAMAVHGNGEQIARTDGCWIVVGTLEEME